MIKNNKIKTNKIIGIVKSNNNINYVIKSTLHSNIRSKERSIKDKQVLSIISQIDISDIKTEIKDVMIIDTDNNISVVFGINQYTITIITLIEKKDPFIKSNTRVIRL